MYGVPSEWSDANGLTPAFRFAHNLASVFPPSLYLDHPDFFPLLDGKRLQPPNGSWFWNPDIAREDVARYAAKAARTDFETNPALVSFALGVNDALIWGESPELLALTGGHPPPSGIPARRSFKWFRERPDYSNLVFTFMNRAAAELEETHPDKYLGALAYYWSENAPEFPLHPQVVPFLTADRSQGYDAKFKREELELQARWGRLAGGRRPEDGGGMAEGRNSGDSEFQNSGVPSSGLRLPASVRRLGLYDYLYGGGFLIPRIHTRLLAENLRHARQAGFTDYFAEVNPNWGLDGPMPWLAAQLLQDTGQSATVLLDEYYARYFREAAVPMRRFFERCEELWMAQPGPPYWLKHYRNQSQAVVFPESAVRELRSMLDAAQRDAWFGRTRARVQQVSAAFGVTERFLAFQEARDRLKRLALAPSPGGAAVAAAVLTDALDVYLGARREFIRYTTELQSADPLAVLSFGWDDYLKDDPVPVALFAIQRTKPTGTALGVLLAGGPKGGSEIPRERGPAVNAGPTILEEPNVAGLWKALSDGGAEAGGAEARKDEKPVSSSAAGTPTLRPSDPPTTRQLLRNPSMTGDVKPWRTIAGLTYGVALPSEWQSRVEPAEFHQAELVGEGTDRAVRISGTKDTTVSQWAPMPARLAMEPGGLQRAGVTVRGRVSPGTAVHLVFSWLDAKERHLGFKMLRLPDGDWPEWVTLQQAGWSPPGAAWVGLGIRVQNQVAGDWVEGKAFSVFE